MGNSISCVNERSTKSKHVSKTIIIHNGKACINRTVPSGETLLTIAAHNGDLQLATYLIAQGAKVDQQNANGTSSLHVAIQARHEHILDLLLNCGVDVNAVDRCGFTPLHLACIQKYSSAVQKLLEAGSLPNGIPDNSNHYLSTPLMATVENDDLPMTEILLRSGAEVDKRDWWMNTALLKAVQVGNVSLVKLLLRHGADPNVENRFGRTALHYSTIADHCEITRVLAESGCQIKGKNEPHSTAQCSKDKAIAKYSPLAASIHRSCYSCFKFFLDKGVDINENIKCKTCKTPLLYAVTNRTWDCHDQHLRSAAQCIHSENPNCVDSTRLDFAVELIERGSLLRPVWEGVVWQIRSMFVSHADWEVLSLLIQAMGFIHLENFKVETFYRTMVQSDQWDAVWLLYCAGYDINEECRNLTLGKRRSMRMSIERPYGPSRLWVEPKTLQWLETFLQDTLTNPRSLKNICVIKLRESLPENVFYYAKKLSLPRSLYDTVTLASFSRQS